MSVTAAADAVIRQMMSDVQEEMGTTMEKILLRSLKSCQKYCSQRLEVLRQEVLYEVAHLEGYCRGRQEAANVASETWPSSYNLSPQLISLQGGIHRQHAAPFDFPLGKAQHALQGARMANMPQMSVAQPHVEESEWPGMLQSYSQAITVSKKAEGKASVHDTTTSMVKARWRKQQVSKNELAPIESSGSVTRAKASPSSFMTPQGPYIHVQNTSSAGEPEDALKTIQQQQENVRYASSCQGPSEVHFQLDNFAVDTTLAMAASAGPNHVDGVCSSTGLDQEVAADKVIHGIDDAALDPDVDTERNDTSQCIAQLLHLPHSWSQCTLSIPPSCIEEEKMQSPDEAAREDLCKFLKRHHMLSDEAKQALESPNLPVASSGRIVRMLDLERETHMTPAVVSLKQFFEDPGQRSVPWSPQPREVSQEIRGAEAHILAAPDGNLEAHMKCEHRLGEIKVEGAPPGVSITALRHHREELVFDISLENELWESAQLHDIRCFTVETKQVSTKYNVLARRVDGTKGTSNIPVASNSTENWHDGWQLVSSTTFTPSTTKWLDFVMRYGQPGVEVKHLSNRSDVEVSAFDWPSFIVEHAVRSIAWKVLHDLRISQLSKNMLVVNKYSGSPLSQCFHIALEDADEKFVLRCTLKPEAGQEWLEALDDSNVLHEQVAAGCGWILERVRGAASEAPSSCGEDAELDPASAAMELKSTFLRMVTGRGDFWVRKRIQPLTAAKDLWELVAFTGSNHLIFEEANYRGIARCLAALADDPAKKEALKRASTTLKHIPTRSPTLPQDNPFWIVVGGTHTQGICVRREYDTLSPKLPEKLATGTLVQQIHKKGFRLKFMRLFGEGPLIGWVSIEVPEGGTTKTLMMTLF